MQLLSTERANRNRDQLSLQDAVSELQKSLQSEQHAAEGSDEVLMFLLFYDHLPELLSVLSRFLWDGGRDKGQGDSFFVSLFLVLRSEIRDLRLVLQSSDKELATAKNELSLGRSEQQRETSQLSNSLISTQLQLDKVQ